MGFDRLCRVGGFLIELKDKLLFRFLLVNYKRFAHFQLALFHFPKINIMIYN
jgi:hypothetical protein